MDLLLPIFQLLYFVAHFLVSLALSLYDTYRDLHRLLLIIYSYLRPGGVSTYQMQSDASMMKKIPEHIGIIIIGHHTDNVSQLSKIVNWCVGYGVKYLSLYDIHGRMKQNKSRIFEALKKRGICAKFDLKTHSTDCHQIKEIFAVNGEHMNESLLPLVTINLLSLGDGKGNLVSVARNLCGNTFKIDPSAVNSCLLTQDQPDPEVVITIGEPMTTLGFLPWQIRLSEIFEVSSLSRFEYSEFRTILRKYSKCEQRCGK